MSLADSLAGLQQSATTLKTKMADLVTNVNKKADAQTMTTELGKKADLGADGKVPSGQLPSLDYIPTSYKQELQTELGKKADAQTMTTELAKKSDKTHSHNDSLVFDAAANTLTFTKSNGETQTYSLLKYLDNNTAALASASYDAVNKKLVFTREDSTSFSVDTSVFFDDTNLVMSVNGKTGSVVLTASDVGAVPEAAKGVANGVASLGADGKVPSDQLPSFEKYSSITATSGAITIDLSVANSFGFNSALTGAVTLNFVNAPSNINFSIATLSGATAYAITLGTVNGTTGVHKAVGGLSKLSLTTSSTDKLVCEYRNGVMEWAISKDIKA